MVETQLCTRCGGLGRVMTLDEPPADPSSEEGWETCPQCKGAKVEMAQSRFEVYFVFADEEEARAFMDSPRPTAALRVGIRVAKSDPASLLLPPPPAPDA